VEPACAVLEMSPSTYYAAKRREENPSARDERDEELKKAIMQAREKRGRKLYGAKKMWRELNRDGIEVARCTVERLMREMGLEGLRARKKRPRTTVPGPAGQERPSDLLERDFTAPAPNRRWVADITYIETSVGFVYAAFILDLFSRVIVGWQVSDTLRAELALDASKWPSGLAAAGWTASLSIIRIAEFSILRSAIPSGLARSAQSGRSGARAIPP
jgi:putative transposase